MENQYQTLTDRLNEQVNALLAQFESLKQENKLLKTQVESAQQEIVEHKKAIAECKANYERLKLANAFGMSEESKKRAHLRITRMVRDIDTCLALLKE